MPSFLWGELMFAAAFLSNRVPHSTLNMVTPLKKLCGLEENLSHLRVMGARLSIHMEIHTNKLTGKSWEASLCGERPHSTSYRIYNSTTKDVVESRNVVVLETLPHILPPYCVYDNDYDNYDTSLQDICRHFVSLNQGAVITSARSP